MTLLLSQLASLAVCVALPNLRGGWEGWGTHGYLASIKCLCHCPLLPFPLTGDKRSFLLTSHVAENLRLLLKCAKWAALHLILPLNTLVYTHYICDYH